VKRVVLLVVLVAVTVLGVDALADATQNRPDPIDPGSTTTVEFDVATRRYSRSDDAAAQALWAVCSATTHYEIVRDLEPTDEGWSATFSPALGHHGTLRLTGCLEDTTVDRVLGRVVSITSTP
jgi:hypothetical protein